jgi:imidazolonepropionase-like amidohydrolase
MYGIRADVAFDGERSLPDGALVLVEGGVIVGVEPASAAAPYDCDVTFRPGATVLPGLIDVHTHLCANAGPDALDRLPGLDDDEIDAVVEASLAAHLAAGVTAVRDLGDQQWAVVDRHRHRADGPWVVASGPPVTSIDGHCAAMGGAVHDVDGLRQAVRDRADRGADLVKIMASGGSMTTTSDVLACQFTQEELTATVAEAHRLGLAVAAHAHAVAAAEQAVAASVDTIEHCSCLTAHGVRMPPGLPAAIVAAGISVCPTLGRDLSRAGGIMPPQIRAMMAKTGMTDEDRTAQVGELHRRGVTLISGDDSGINLAKPHGLLPRAVGELVDCGVPGETALASATAMAARACGLDARTGRLKPGLGADLLLVDGNALVDITALMRPSLILSRGLRVDPESGRPAGHPGRR